MGKSIHTDWQVGHSLWEAIQKFAPRNIWDEFAPLYSRFCSPIPADLIQTPSFDDAPPPLADPMQDFARFMQLDAELKTWIISQLNSGQFQAFAFPKIRLRGAKPVRLDPSVWKNGKYSWEADEMWADSGEYNEIRVIPTKCESSGARKTGTKGRPSNVRMIEKAWVKLCKTGAVEKYSNLRAAFHAIRDLIEADNPEIQFKQDEPSESALYKVLGPLWDQRRARPK